MLTGLKHFTLVLMVGWPGDPDKVRRVLEPLKNLRVKDRWELRIDCSPWNIDLIETVDTTLKAAGYGCIVSHWRPDILQLHGLSLS